jgi:hypothetical protein
MNFDWVRCKFGLCCLQHTNLICIAIIVQGDASFLLNFYKKRKGYKILSIST